jgi:hypothetical protein
VVSSLSRPYLPRCVVQEKTNLPTTCYDLLRFLVETGFFDQAASARRLQNSNNQPGVGPDPSDPPSIRRSSTTRSSSKSSDPAPLTTRLLLHASLPLATQRKQHGCNPRTNKHTWCGGQAPLLGRFSRTPHRTLYPGRHSRLSTSGRTLQSCAERGLTRGVDVMEKVFCASGIHRQCGHVRRWVRQG